MPASYEKFSQHYNNIYNVETLYVTAETLNNQQLTRYPFSTLVVEALISAFFLFELFNPTQNKTSEITLDEFKRFKHC